MRKLIPSKEYHNGIYIPVHKEKYIGHGNPIYRSSYELKFMRWADHNPNVLKWGSENVVIPYFHPIDKIYRRYFVDNFVVLKEGDSIAKYLIEIKPFKQTQPPKHNKNKKQSTILYENITYAVNISKWEAAEAYCKKRGWKFVILTENELHITK